MLRFQQILFTQNSCEPGTILHKSKKIIDCLTVSIANWPKHLKKLMFDVGLLFGLKSELRIYEWSNFFHHFLNLDAKVRGSPVAQKALTKHYIRHTRHWKKLVKRRPLVSGSGS